MENHKNLIHVSIHAGVGAGIILDHHLYTGLAGTAGEAGHMIVQPAAVPVPAAITLSRTIYIRTGSSLPLPGVIRPHHVSIDDLVWAYNQKETAALAVMDEFTTYLACGINNLWNLFSPECIILNCQLTAYLPQLLPEICRTYPYRSASTSSHLKLSTLQDTGVLLGAAKVCISKYLGTEKLYFSGLQP